MTLPPMAQLCHTGARLLQIRQQICKTSRRKGWLPAAFIALMVDPTTHFSQTLSKLYGGPAAVEGRDQQAAEVSDFALSFVPSGADRLSRPMSRAARPNPLRSASPGVSQPVHLMPQANEPVRAAAGSPRTHFNVVSGGSRGPVSIEEREQSPHLPSSSPAMVPSLPGIFRTMGALNIPIPGEAQATGDPVAWPAAAQKGRQPEAEGQPDPLIYTHDQSEYIHRAEQGVSGAPGQGDVPQNRTARPDSPSLPQVSTDGAEMFPGPRPVEVADTNDPLPAWPKSQRMVRNASQLAAVLHANLRTPEEISGQPLINQSEVESTPPPATQEIEPGTNPSEGIYEPDFKGQVDLEELIDRLADHLELEFIRTYGTSGR